MSERIQVLLITSDPAEASQLQAMLAENGCPAADGPEFVPAWVANLDAALERLEQERFSVALVDLSPSGSIGPEAISRLRAHPTHPAIIALIDQSDPERVSQIVRQGAQDCLTKGHINGSLLRCVLRCTVERQRRENLLRENGIRYRMMFEQSNAAIIACQAIADGEDFLILDFNPTAERITRVRREQVLGRRLRETFPNVEKTPLLDAMRRVWHTGQPEHLQPFYYPGMFVQRWFESWTYKLPSGEIVSLFDDVTDRIEAEQALRESEERYRLIADFVYAWEYWIGPDGQILYMSPSCERITGYRPEEFIQDSDLLVRIVHPDDRLRFSTHICTELETNRECKFEFRIIRRDGQERCISHHCYRVFSEEGVCRGRRASNIDVTEHKRIEAELREQHDRMASLYQIGQAITSTLDLEEVLERVASSARTVLKSEIVWILLYEEADDELVIAAINGPPVGPPVGTRLPTTTGISGWVWRTGQPALIDDVRKDPHFCDSIDNLPGLNLHSLVAVPLQHRNRNIGVIAAANRANRSFDTYDVAMLGILAGFAAPAVINARLYEETAHHLAEIRALHEIILAAASTLDFDQVLERALQAVHRALGVEFLCYLIPDESQRRLIVHQSVIGLESPPEGPLEVPMDRSVAGRVYLTGQPMLIANTTEVPFFFTLPGMTEIRSELAVPVRRGDRVIAVLDAGRRQRAAFDENDLRMFEAIAAQLSVALENARLYQAEREQRQRVEQSHHLLIQVEKMAALGRLIASIAHEINNPLQAIQGCLMLAQEMLATGEPRDEVESYLSLASGEIDRIADIMRRLREFYRPSPTSMQMTDVHTVIDGVLLLCHQKLQESRVRVERDLAPDLPLIQVNPAQLRQVVLNLLLNAVEAMPQGGIIRIRTARGQIQADADAPPRPAVRIEFSDTGVGMPPEVAARAFEPFFTTKPGGSGLGLPVSYAIVTAHHGQISLSTQEGMGTTLTILLPVEQPQPESEEGI